MNQFRWIPHKPKFKSGDPVWIIEQNTVGPRRVSPTAIASVPANVVEESSGVLTLHWEGWYAVARLVSFTKRFKHPTWCYKTYVFATEPEAAAAAKWRGVDATADEWLRAIGDRRGSGVDDCDLGVCCAAISDIRDRLDQIRRSSGVTEVDRLSLQAAMFSHERPESLDKDGSALAKILDQLGVKWEADQ